MYSVPQRHRYPGSFYWPPALFAIAALSFVGLIFWRKVHPLYYRGVPFLKQPNASLMFRYVAFATLAVFVIMIIVRAANAHRMRNFADGMESIHGSARFAEHADVEASGLLATEGVYVGGWHDKGYLHYLMHNGPEHILTFAPPRSGKTVGLVIPTLLAWEDSAVIYDVKGEIWTKTAGFRASIGQVCFKFSPVEDGTSSRFNPLAEIRIGTTREVADAQNIAEIIVPEIAGASGSSKHFRDAGASIVSGMILHVCYVSATTNRVASFADLAEAFTSASGPIRDRLTDILSYEHDPAGTRGWHTPDGKPTKTHPVVAQKIAELLNRVDSEFSGVVSSASTPLALFSDPLVAQNTNSSDFRIADLVAHERPVSLYIIVPPSDQDRLAPLTRILFTLIVSRLTEKLDYSPVDPLTRRHRLLFMIDEFPSLGRMSSFQRALAIMAGYGMKAYLIAQDIVQIVDAYGIHQSIVSGCHMRIAYAPNHQGTAKDISDMTGTRTIERASPTFSGDRSSSLLKSASVTVVAERRPLLTPEEVSQLKPPEKDGERITEPGQMLIFAAGQPPILGTQILYFKDPELLRRSEITPPTLMVRIDTGGAVEDQLQVSRTEHELSPPERMPTVQETLHLAAPEEELNANWIPIE